MDLASETLTRPGNDSGTDALACACALHEPRRDCRVLGEYTSFSSFSEAWLAHARHYGHHAVRRFNLGAGSVVLKLAGSGQEPAGVSGREFFSHEAALDLAAQGKAADLVIAGHVLTHAPDRDDVAAGFAAILKPAGILILEIRHALGLSGGRGPNDIDHEALPSFSLRTLEALLARRGLRVFDADALSPQGGGLRLFCCHAAGAHPEQFVVTRLRHAEKAAGLSGVTAPRAFEAHASEPVSVG